MDFSKDQLYDLLTTNDLKKIMNLKEKAKNITKSIYGNKIFIRGLLEISNYCKQDCNYCGIRRSNVNLDRFRLSKEEIYNQADLGYDLGFKTIVLQGGEDSYYTDEILVEIVKTLKRKYPEIAITLSLGIRNKKSYKALKDAGADRYLLRHESRNEEVFSLLHPKEQSVKQRIKALEDLRSCGFHIGTGFLVGAPFANIKSYIEDILFIRKLKPEMIGIGPFIPYTDSIYSQYPSGDLELTLRLIAILRIENPYALIPSTTALNTIDENGRILGILSGANVIMPNLSPQIARDNYRLYDNKKSTNLESASNVQELNELLQEYGYEIEFSRGDYKGE